jgi:diphthine-ammonia ligase
MQNVFVSWSGGKDCCQAAYKAQQDGNKIRYLLNMVTQDGQRSCSHGIAARWIKLQSEAMEIPALQRPTTGENYEAVFIDALAKIKQEGVETGIFGDIDFIPHLEWIQKVCAQAGVTPVLPLWQKDQFQLARDFIALGFVAVIVAVRADLLGPEWLGRKFDHTFLGDSTGVDRGITPCGEAGEFHSLVIDGPLFKKRIEITEAAKIQRENYWFLDIRECALVRKYHDT